MPDGSISAESATGVSVGASCLGVKYRLVRCIPSASPHLSIIVHSSNLFAGIWRSNNF